jgi:branched-chain amino acid aminotransferase
MTVKKQMLFLRQAIKQPSTAFKAAARHAHTPAFGRQFTDHMVTILYSKEHSWHNARLEPVAPIELHPASAVLHYAQEIFEGLKAFRTADGRIQVFRPHDNARRFIASARRMAMPELPESMFVAAVDELVQTDRDWVPKVPDTLYIRPFMIACEPGLGAKAATQYLFTVIACPVGPYDSSGRDALRVWVSTTIPRASSGGTGAAKCGGNYAASLLAQQEARKHDCEYVVFLDSVERLWVEELGSMNIFLIFEDESMVTPPLNGNILPGITRDSLIALARAAGHVVHEMPYSLENWRCDAASGRLVEAFACGTAAGVVAIGEVVTTEAAFAIGNGLEGPRTRHWRRALTSIQYGLAPDPNGWVHPVA